MKVLTADSPIQDWVDRIEEINKGTWAPRSLEAHKHGQSATFCFWDRNRPIKSFTTDDVLELLTYWRDVRKLGGNQMRQRLGRVKTWFQLPMLDEIISRNPVRYDKLPKIQVEEFHRMTFSYEEFQLLHDQFSKFQDYRAEMWKFACTTAYYSGLRLSDVINLAWRPNAAGTGTWVDMDNEIIIAHPLKRRKVRQRLEIPIEPELYEVLKYHLDKKMDDFWEWVNLEFHAMGINNNAHAIKRGFREMVQKAGLHGRTFHSFRHGFVSRLVNAGVSSLVIASMTGQTLEVIQGYARISKDAKINALAMARKALHASHLDDLGIRPPNRLTLV